MHGASFFKEFKITGDEGNLREWPLYYVHYTGKAKNFSIALLIIVYRKAKFVEGI